MSSPKISVLIYTARGDHPYVNSNWHCFDPVVKTLAAQTFKDFELVLVDMHWESRSDWFENNPQPFPVKHVPSSPNRWQSQRRAGLCEQINRGFAWADGDLTWMGGENNLFPPTHLARAWQIYSQTGTLPVAWYAICGTERRGQRADCPAAFDLMGYTHEHVHEIDHRAQRFIDRRAPQLSPCHYQNYFGYSGVSTSEAVRVNGFDELFDGQWGLFDVDFGSRLDLAGNKMTMARDLYVIEPPVAPTGTREVYLGVEHQEAFKCHYAILLHNRATWRRANHPLPINYIADVKRRTCHGECSLKEKCAAGSIGESKYYPFCEGKNRAVALELLATPTVRELADDRQLRIAGTAPFDRGTFTTPMQCI